MEIYIQKRDGKKELLDLEKIHKVVSWACEDIKGVSVSEVELKSQLKFYNGMKSKDIHETLTKTASDLISEDTPNYQYVASRFINFNLRKEVYKNINPRHIYDIVKENVANKYYEPKLLEWYSEEEYDKLESYIKHERDYNIPYAGMGQWLGKYLVQNRVTKQYFETPQIAYMLIAATIFHKYPKSIRLKYVKDYYDALSLFDISIPTPVLGGARTPTKQFSSCVLISCDDSLESINQTASSIVDYVSKKAGIGVEIGSLRALGSEIRGGEVKHTGLIPFMKYFQSALKSCSQGGIRGGAATVYFPYFHHEFENLVVLKNNKGIEENRVRHMDYGILMNRLAYKRLRDNQNITLFSPHEVPDLMNAFYKGDNDLFEELYVKYEKSRFIKMKKTITAFELFDNILSERFNTGRIYILNIDNANMHSAFDQNKHPIRQSNLCTEILLPTVPMGMKKIEYDYVEEKNFVDYNLQIKKDLSVIDVTTTDRKNNVLKVEVTRDLSRIALCTLSAINWGNIKNPEDFEKPCDLAVRGLDELLSYQDYPVRAAALATEEFRPLGIGINNLAYFLAKNNKKYDHDAVEIVHRYTEAMAYYLTKATVQLAKEFGPCKLSKETKYGMGMFPWENRKPEFDSIIENKLEQDWETLREDMLKYGVRNATTMAVMPSESSSQLINATNGIEPVRSLITEKGSKDGVLKMVVPEFSKLKNKYDLLWDQKTPEGYLILACTMQKFIDQTISTNTSYNPLHYPNGKVALKDLISDLVLFYMLGGITLYYNNTYDNATDEHEEKIQIPVNTVQTQIEDDCEGCKL